MIRVLRDRFGIFSDYGCVKTYLWCMVSLAAFLHRVRWLAWHPAGSSPHEPPQFPKAENVARYHAARYRGGCEGDLASSVVPRSSRL